MKCEYCKAVFNNMEIGKSHSRACVKNPANKGKSKYRLYLDAQIYRFRGIRFGIGQGADRRKAFINKVFSFIYSTIDSVLIIGAADTTEKDHVICKGVNNVIAIDLNVHCQGVIKMDMHKLSFPDNTFDLVIASHTLEHSYNANSVFQQVARVLKDGGYFACEVPVNYKTNDVDRIDFLNAGTLLCRMQNALPGYALNMMWSEELAFNEKGNYCSTDVLKALIKIEKLEGM